MKPILLLILSISGFFIASRINAQVPNILNYQGRIAVRGVPFEGTGQFKFALVNGGTVTTPAARTATASAVVNSGFVTSVTVVDGGAGYVTAPIVTISGGGGNGATAVANVTDGAVTGFTITSPGSDYGSAPTVNVGAPPAPTPTTDFVSYWSNDGTSVAGSEPTSTVELAVTKGLFSVKLGDTATPDMQALPDSVFEHSDLHLRIWFNDGDKGWQRFANDVRILPSAFSVKSTRSGKLVLRDHPIVRGRSINFVGDNTVYPSTIRNNLVGVLLPIYMRGSNTTQSGSGRNSFEVAHDFPLGFSGEIAGLTIDCEAKNVRYDLGGEVSVVLLEFDVDQTVETILFQKVGEWVRDVFEAQHNITIDPTKQYLIVIRFSEVSRGPLGNEGVDMWLNALTLKIKQIIHD